MKEFDTPEEEVRFLFGQHAIDKALKREPEYYVRKVDQRAMADAMAGLRFRYGPARKRFARGLQEDLAAAMIHALLDPDHWDRLVMEAAISRVPQEKRRRSRRSGTKTVRSVRRRKMRTKRVDDD